MNKDYNLAIISGSNRIGSKSRQIAKWLQKHYSQQTGVAHCHLMDLSAYNFPVMDERLGFLENPHPGLEEFSTTMHQADALIFVTPEYNGGMAGSLKNALDYFRKEFNRKPIGAVTVSSGDFGGVNALHQLWYVMLHCGAIVSPSKLMIGQVNGLLDENGNISDERFIKRADGFLENLIWLTQKIQHP
jgi:azobenzene reductase